jgi:hypothetical protein
VGITPATQVIKVIKDITLKTTHTLAESHNTFMNLNLIKNINLFPKLRDSLLGSNLCLGKHNPLDYSLSEDLQSQNLSKKAERHTLFWTQEKEEEDIMGDRALSSCTRIFCFSTN